MLKRKRILLLIALHLGVGLTAAFLGPTLLQHSSLTDALRIALVVAFVGLWAAQATLLGCFGGLAQTTLRKRLLALGAGCFYLWLLALAAEESWDMDEEAVMFACWTVLPVAAVAGLLSWTRSRWVQVAAPQPGAASSGEPNEGLRFSTRQLFLLTGAIAVLFAGGRLVSSLGGDSSTLVMLIVVTPMFAACGIAVGAATLWAGLGLYASFVRALAVIALAAALGAIPASYFSGVWWRWLVWPSVLIAQSAIVIASLWVVRSCGYWLQRLPRPQSPALQKQSPAPRGAESY